MVKNLRYLLMGMLVMLGMTAMAQTEFDFDENGTTLLGLAGESSSDSQDGDITENKTATIGDYSVTVSAGVPGENGKVQTPNRLWNKSPKLRMYSGSLTIAATGASKIKSIVFTLAPTASAAKWNDGNTASAGTLNTEAKTSVTWSGEASEVVISIAANTQISKITVSSEGSVTPDPDPDPTPGDVVKATCAEILAGTDGTVYEVKGVCTEIKNTTYGNWMLTDETGEVYIYGTLDAEGNTKNFSSLNIEVGDTVTVKGPRKTYNETVELADVTVLALAKKQGGDNPDPDPDPQPGETTGKGTLESPYTVADAIKVVSAMEGGVTSTQDYYIKGKISSIKYTFSAQYGTATFNISDDGAAENEFTCYGVYYLENKAWVEGNTQVAVGDEVIVCGKVVNYNGNTPETANKKAYIYSLNGNTKNESGEQPEPEVKEVSVAQALEIIAALENGKSTTEEYKITGYVVSLNEDFNPEYGNYTFMLGETTSTSQITVFRAKNADNEKFIEDVLKVNDAVVVQGKLQKYVKGEEVTPEVSSCRILTINGNTATGINEVKAQNRLNGAIYNLKGQRVSVPAKGLFIKDGKKFFVK